jgi:hypothetical protein
MADDVKAISTARGCELLVSPTDGATMLQQRGVKLNGIAVRLLGIMAVRELPQTHLHARVLAPVENTLYVQIAT